MSYGGFSGNTGFGGFPIADLFRARTQQQGGERPGPHMMPAGGAMPMAGGGMAPSVMPQQPMPGGGGGMAGPQMGGQDGGGQSPLLRQMMMARMMGGGMGQPAASPVGAIGNAIQPAMGAFMMNRFGYPGK